jgi:hypothetical protein
VDIETGPLYQDQFDKGLDLAIYGGVLASSSRIAPIKAGSQGRIW